MTDLPSAPDELLGLELSQARAFLGTRLYEVVYLENLWAQQGDWRVIRCREKGGDRAEEAEPIWELTVTRFERLRPNDVEGEDGAPA